MHTESVGANTRSLVNFCSLLLVDEATLDHPPTDCTLKSTQGKHTYQHISEMWHYVASREKVSHRQEKDDTNGSANDSVEPLPKEDVLELLHTHVLELIVIDPLW